jgi:hypothetical protein
MAIQVTKHQLSSEYSHQLRDSHLHLSQTRIYSDSSFIIFLENLSIKAKKFIREQHLDINIPRTIVVAALLFSVFVMIKDRPMKGSNYKLAKDLAASIGVGTGIIFTMTSFHNRYHYNKLNKASQYVEAWNDKYLCEINRKVRAILNEAILSKCQIEFDENLFNRCHSNLCELKKNARWHRDFKRNSVRHIA